MIGSFVNAILSFIFEIHFVVGFIIGGAGLYMVGLNRNRKAAMEELLVAKNWTDFQIGELRKKLDELYNKIKG